LEEEMIVMSMLLLFGVMGFYCATRGIFSTADSSGRANGSRFVDCTEMKHPAVISISAGTLSPAGYRVMDRVRVSECSNWPAHQACSEGCLKQIEAR
jgi:hypothetical protein